MEPAADRSLGRTCTALIFVVVSFCTPTSPPPLPRLLGAHEATRAFAFGAFGAETQTCLIKRTHAAACVPHLLIADKRPRPSCQKIPPILTPKFCPTSGSRSSGCERAFTRASSWLGVIFMLMTMVSMMASISAQLSYCSRGRCSFSNVSNPSHCSFKSSHGGGQPSP